MDNSENTSKNNNKEKSKKHKKVIRILSMVAVIIIVFALGMNMNKFPILENGETSNLISINAIEPTKLESGILANNSEFLIQVEGKNVTTDDVQKSVYVEPALDYTIEKTPNNNEYKLKFKQNIPDNTIVKLQYVKNQITEDSWAYQTSNKLSITKTYPENKSMDVSQNTIIDVEFSYANVENFEQYVSISPEVGGQWKHLGKIWRFTPNTELQDKETYIVRISKGIVVDDQTLENDYTSSFTVGNNSDLNVHYSSITVDGIVNTKPNELARITYSKDYSRQDIQFGKVEIRKFNNIDEFISYLENSNYEKAEKQGDYTVQDNKTAEYNGYLELKETLPIGYYVARVKNANGKELFNVPVQVSDYSSYAMETERDVIVWAAKGNDLAPNINVEYLGKTETTDSNGVAKFRNIADGSEKIKYMKVGNELVIGVYNYSLENYPSGYIYTDRPLYKNTDTINIWGFIPRKLFYDKIDEEFYVKLGTEGKQKVNVDEDGNFIYQIDLKNHLSQEAIGIELYYKETQIAYKEISIQNYELQNYTYQVITDKKYAKEGETVNFDVKVTHITGLMVPNKKVTISYYTNEQKHTDTQLTGEDGIAHFSVKLNSASSTSDTTPEYQLIEVYNGDENEYTTSETEYTIAVLKRNTYTAFDEPESNQYKATLYKLAEDRNVTEVNYDLHELYNGTYETDVDIYLVEDVLHRYIIRYNYNEYTKENEPEYGYYRENTENRTKIKTVKSTNGIVELENSEIKTKEDTQDERYTYYIEFEYKDLDGKQVKDTTYYYDYKANVNEVGYIYTGSVAEGGESDDRLFELPINGYIDYNYNIYRYFFKNEYKNYAIGDKINLTLAESTENGVKEIENQGKLLTVVFKEDIIENDILTENTFTHEFTEKDFPGCKITASYFINGKFYRMPVQYFDFDEETRTVDIEIIPDKDEYNPGDTVNLTLKATCDGKGIKTNINVSVANEAVFEVQGDTTDLIEQIYTSKDYAAYTYSSYLDYLKTEGGGGGRRRRWSYQVKLCRHGIL